MRLTGDGVVLKVVVVVGVRPAKGAVPAEALPAGRMVFVLVAVVAEAGFWWRSSWKGGVELRGWRTVRRLSRPRFWTRRGR